MPRQPRTSDMFPMDKWYPYSVGPLGALGLASGGTTPGSITFPGVPIRTRVMIALSPDFTQPYLTWNWAEITTDTDGSTIVRWEQQIDITYGGRPNSAVVEASLCMFRATNDRRFSRRNPLSPYYNQLSEYTPLWIQMDYGLGWKDKYFGFIHDFAKAWDTTGTDSYVDMSARGPLHRIGKSKPLKSPLNRASSGTTAGDIKPFAYWPMEDGAQATFFASAIAGQPNMEIVLLGDTVLASSSAVVGSLPLPEFALDSNAHAVVPAYTDTGAWAVTSVVYSADFSDGFAARTADIRLTGGTVATISVLVFDNTFALVAADSSDSVIDLDDSPFTVGDVTGIPLYIVVTFQTDGTLVAYAMLDSGVITSSVTLALGGGMYGMVTDLYPNGANVSVTDNHAVYGHYAVYIDPAFTAATDGVENAKAVSGFDGERAIPRLRRLSREQNIPFYATGSDEDSAQCGPQLPGSLITNLRAPEKVDGGRIYEWQFGIAYKSYAEFVNQAVTFTVDAALGQLREVGSPVDNDLDFVNQWTIDRPSGSSATVQARKGEAGVTLNENELVYESGDTVSAFEDDQLESIAARYGRQSTVDEDRWPTLGFHLAKNPELIEAWQAFAFGGRIQALNVYEEVGLTTLDQIHRGHHESWNSLKWEVTMNCAPTSAYDTFQLDDAELGRLDSGSSTLTFNISDSQADFLVSTEEELDEWVTSDFPDEFPFDIELFPGTGAAISSGGELITIDTITPAIIDTYARAEADWGIASTGELWTILSGTPAVFTTTGSAGRMALATVNVEHIAVVDLMYADQQRVRVSNLTAVTPTGAAINWGVILRCADANNMYWIDVALATAVNGIQLRLIRKVGGVNVLLATSISLVSHSTVIPRTLITEVTPDNWLRAKIYALGDPEPVWEIEYQDVGTSLVSGTKVGCISRLTTGNTNVPPVNIDFSNFTVRNPQRFYTDARSVNGIVKAHKAGAVVHVANMNVIE